LSKHICNTIIPFAASYSVWILNIHIKAKGIVKFVQRKKNNWTQKLLGDTVSGHLVNFLFLEGFYRVLVLCLVYKYVSLVMNQQRCSIPSSHKERKTCFQFHFQYMALIEYSIIDRLVSAHVPNLRIHLAHQSTVNKFRSMEYAIQSSGQSEKKRRRSHVSDEWYKGITHVPDHPEFDQISVVKKTAVLAVLGTTGNSDKPPCQLWFFLSSKRSSSHEAYVEGHWLHDMCDGTTSVSEFGLHPDEDEVQIAKATVIDIVDGFTERDGIYSISQSTIEELKRVVSYEDDSTKQCGYNGRIINLKTPVICLNEAALLDALSRADCWKEKVKNVIPYLLPAFS
jgi:hypothetical protein